MSRTLPEAREAFVAAIKQDTPGTDLPRFVAVLDALIAWSVARPELLAFRVDAGRNPVVGFERVGSKVVFWSAQVTRGTGPRLEIYPPSGAALTDDDRATVMRTLNAHSREMLMAGDRLRIGFSALKNGAAQTAVLALREPLLAGSGRATEAAAAGVSAGATSDAPPAA
jgi:hypothetical protein